MSSATHVSETASWLEEATSDAIGVRFAGLVHSNEIARRCATSIGQSPYHELCGSLAHARVPDVYSGAAGGRPVVKVAACATDALRHAISIAGRGGRVLWALGSYVGGDVDFSELSTASRFDNSDALKDEEALPLPYVVGEAARAKLSAGDACTLVGAAALRELERKCLTHLLVRVLAGRLAANPVTAIVLELVLSNNGLQLSAPFLQRLGRLCAALGVAIVLDETMTFARCHGRVILDENNKSLLAIDAMGIAGILQPRCIVAGKVAGMGIVWGVRGESSRLEPGRGTSTSIGLLRLRYAQEVLEALLSEDLDVEGIRSCLLAQLEAGTTQGKRVIAWGCGLLFFASTRFELMPSDRNVVGRMLPTRALARMDIPATPPSACANGLSIERLERAFLKRVALCCADPPPANELRHTALLALSHDGQTGSRPDLKRVLGGGRPAELWITAHGKRNCASNSRVYCIHVGSDVRAAHNLIDSE